MGGEVAEHDDEGLEGQEKEVLEDDGQWINCNLQMINCKLPLKGLSLMIEGENTYGHKRSTKQGGGM